MGLTVFKGRQPRKDGSYHSKNYLDEKELNILNRITSAYLEFAELQSNQTSSNDNERLDN